MPMSHECDIAIVGMSGRFPGARNVAEFWHNLAEGIESITRLSDQEILLPGQPELREGGAAPGTAGAF